MQQSTRIKLFISLCGVFSTAALPCIYAAFRLIDYGANPPAGESSLGHVGIVVAGLGAGFLAVVLALLALWAGLRARDIKRTRSE